MRAVSRRRLLAVGAAGAGVAALGIGYAHHRASSEPLAGPVPVAVRSVRIDHFSLRQPDLKRFGALDFVGGLELSASEPGFGGLSGLALTPDGRRLTAVTDQGAWFSATLTTDGEVPTGVTDGILAPILGPDGKAVARGRRLDAEGLTIADGVAYVSFERVHEVLRFPLAKGGFQARGEPLPRPAGVGRLRANRGLEALAIVPAGGPHAGSLIAIAEGPPRDEDERPTIPGWFVTGPRGGFEVVRHGPFAVTDAAYAPDGSLLLLERSFAWLDGVAMRIRRIDGREVRPGAVLTGEELIKADMRQQVDNMEGLAVHRAADGRTMLTLVSDDNFSFLQRTILLRFALVG